MRLGHSPQQNGIAKLSLLCQLLSRVLSLASQTCCSLPHYNWSEHHNWREQQQSFNEIKKALIEATVLAQPDSEGDIVLETDAGAVTISGILHQWQGPPGDRSLRPIFYGNKTLTATQAKYGAPKLEMYAAYHFIVENLS